MIIKLLQGLLVVSIASTYMAACYAQSSTDPKSVIRPPDFIVPDRYPPVVPMVRLIVTPEKYSGKRIMTIGYVDFGFEERAVYPYREDVDAEIGTNGIWLGSMMNPKFNLASVNHKYCIIVGVFDPAHHGHMSAFGGTIQSIERLEVWYDPAKARQQPTTPPDATSKPTN